MFSLFNSLSLWLNLLRIEGGEKNTEKGTVSSQNWEKKIPCLECNWDMYSFWFPDDKSMQVVKCTDVWPRLCIVADPMTVIGFTL